MKKIDIIQVVIVALFVAALGATSKMFGWDKSEMYSLTTLILVFNMYLDPRRRLHDKD